MRSIARYQALLGSVFRRRSASRVIQFRQAELDKQTFKLELNYRNSYRGYGLPLADLVQEGNVGLMKAVKRFNPTLSVRLVSSFAVHWIRAEIHEYILRNWRIVKAVTTKAQRKLFFNLRSMKKRLGWISHQEVEAVAKNLGVSSKDVLEIENVLVCKILLLMHRLIATKKMTFLHRYLI